MFGRKPLFFFDDAAAGGNAGNTAEENALNAGGNGGTDEAKKQALLNRQFAERADRAAETERKKLWDALGVKSQDEFDAYVKAKKEADDAQKSELDKATADAQKARAEKERIEADSNARLETAQRRIVDTEIKLAASKAVLDKDGKVVRPAFRADALDVVLAVIDRKKIKDEEGQLTGVDEALAELAKDKKFLLEEDSRQQDKRQKGNPPPADPAKNQTKSNATPEKVVGTTL